MGVARQAPAPAIGGFVFELQAKGHDEGEDTFEERLAITQQLEVGPVTGFVQYAPMLLLWTVSPQDVRGQNIAIKMYFRKSLGEHTDVSHRAAPRLILVPKIIFGK